MWVRLEKNRRPVRVKAHRCSPQVRAFLKRYTDQLVEFSFVEMPTAAWQSASILVSKSGSKSKYRMAIDLRLVISVTVKEAWPMPHIDSGVADFSGSSGFEVLDFVSAYWQLTLDPEL